MIYFDNSATTMIKPPSVAAAVAHAIDNFGNAGRSFHDAVTRANREIFNTRTAISKLIGHDNPLDVAFTSSATESLNMVISGLISSSDTVVTTIAEHNSVLRPLYLSGCKINYLECDDTGQIQLNSAEKLLTLPTKYLICTHGSNVTGNVTNAAALYKICRERGITMILDISQTFGSVPISIDMADIFCFTGHKGLFGPMGTGGIIVKGKHDFKITKTGGSGVNSFDELQSTDRPEIFEVGTLNAHGIYGLQKGVEFINEQGIEQIHAKEMCLTRMFYDGIKGLNNVQTYGDFSAEIRLPIVSFNIAELSSSEVAECLWTEYAVACRAGTHCAPLLHKHLGTYDRGMVRFSFSCFNTEDEIQQGIAAVRKIAEGM